MVLPMWNFSPSAADHFRSFQKLSKIISCSLFLSLFCAPTAALCFISNTCNCSSYLCSSLPDLKILLGEWTRQHFLASASHRTFPSCRIAQSRGSLQQLCLLFPELTWNSSVLLGWKFLLQFPAQLKLLHATVEFQSPRERKLLLPLLLAFPAQSTGIIWNYMK